MGLGKIRLDGYGFLVALQRVVWTIELFQYVRSVEPHHGVVGIYGDRPVEAVQCRFELPELAGSHFEVASSHAWEEESLELFERVTALMNDDLNTPQAVAELFDAVSAAHAAADDGRPVAARRLAQSINVLFGAMGLALVAGSHEIDDESRRLVQERDVARAAADWAEADRLRQALVEKGWIVEDGPAGTAIRRP